MTNSGTNKDVDFIEQQIFCSFSPDGVEDEEQLDEYAAKGQNSSHDDTRERLRVERLLRDLTRDLIGPHWMFNTL